MNCIPSPNEQYSVNATWNAMRQSAGKVPWNSIVRYHRDVPKLAFICRLWCLGKLATKDRLRNGGMNVDEACVLCTQQNESHQNLFFEYYFSRGIWSNIMGRCMFQGEVHVSKKALGVRGFEGYSILSR